MADTMTLGELYQACKKLIEDMHPQDQPLYARNGEDKLTLDGLGYDSMGDTGLAVLDVSDYVPPESVDLELLQEIDEQEGEWFLDDDEFENGTAGDVVNLRILVNLGFVQAEPILNNMRGKYYGVTDKGTCYIAENG